MSNMNSDKLIAIIVVTFVAGEVVKSIAQAWAQRGGRHRGS